jgi:hypothetical protein
MAANNMSDPSPKNITVSFTVRILILCIIRIDTFRIIVKYVEKDVLNVLYFNIERSI